MLSRCTRLAMVVTAAMSVTALPAQATALKVFETAAGAVCGQVNDGMPNCVAGKSGKSSLKLFLKSSLASCYHVLFLPF